MRDFMLVTFSVLGGVAVLSTLAVSLAMGINAYDCSQYSKVTGRETASNFGTCYIKTEKGFIPREELEYRAITNE
ncbi:hypothetical protein QO517_004388 [Salmonella enterica]|nr:hypothetical protein [Salmonella enterica]ELP1955783.1 hypothetical protein [Salmonella enterica]ELX4917812.1 hypothetical protein [Salmonella enterica]